MTEPSLSKNLMLQKINKRFEVLEKICTDGRAVFFMVALALEEIKREKFYEESGFKTFPEYCESIGYSRRHVNQMIADATTLKELPENLRNLVQSERAARELGKIPEILRVAVVSEASSGGTKPVTAAGIKRLAPPPPQKAREPLAPRASTPPPKAAAKSVKPARTVILDGTGLEVPPASLTLWNRMPEVQQLLTMLSAVRGALRKAQEDKDALYAEVDFTDSLAKLNQVYVDVQTAKPFAVCHSCNGKIPTKSCACKGRGFVSEFYWKHAVPAEVRKMRE